MDGNIFWVVDLTLLDVDAFKALAVEMCESTNKEAGALNYEWMLNDDESTCHIYERYADDAAVMAHMATFGEKFAGRFMSMAQPTRFMVYGDPNAEVRAILDTLGAVYMKPFAGFAR